MKPANFNRLFYCSTKLFNSSDPTLRRSLVRRMGAMLSGAATLFYLLTLASMFFGGNYLIEKNLEKQAYQLLPVFDDLSLPLFSSQENNTLHRIAHYATPIADIGLLRIYEKKRMQVLAEYRKPDMPSLPPMQLGKNTIEKPQVHVKRMAGLAQSIQVIGPIHAKPHDLTYADTPISRQSREIIGYVEITMDFSPSRRSLYPGILFTVAVLSIILLIGIRAYIQKMRTALKPLLSLQEPLSRIAKGDFEATVGEGQADQEVEIIREALRTTILALKERELERNEAVRARIEADESNQAKASFLANMSHEIRTPMNGVIGMLELLLDTTLSASQREFVMIAQSSAESLLELINDILDFSKIEAGKLHLDYIPFDLLHQVESIVNAQAKAAEHKGLDLIVHYPPPLPYLITSDPVRIRQVMTNLISNAIKFTAKGHVLIDIKIEQKIEQQSDDHCRLHVSVTDTGIGLAQNKLSTIFDKFTQADTSTTRQYGGTGLGLTICKLLIEMMGGKIGVDSNPGQGSTFWFTLDLQPVSGMPVYTEINQHDIRLLFVDDNPISGQIMKEQLERQGMRVDNADTPDAALDALKKAAATHDPYHIVMLNHQIQDTKGEILGQIIKTDPAWRDILLVILGSLSHANHAERFAQSGFSAFLSKPVPQRILTIALQKLCAALKTGTPPAFFTTASLTSVQPEKLQNAGRFSGYRILVADDNAVNQKVITHMLQKLGCTPDIATNGQKAVEMHAKQRYNLIFMDCQMPELDGYQATARIRSTESTLQHTPIIALTAHAMQGEREKCLAAGMDDFMSKPIRHQILVNMLGNWLTPVAIDITPVTNAPAEIESQDEFDAIQEMFGDDFAELAVLFQTDSARRIDTLHTVMTTNNSAELTQIIHILSGSAVSIGATTLATLCRELEIQLKARPINDLALRVRCIEEEYDKAVKKLQEMIQIIQTKP
jgi:signal transduction histidine kinase/CheY-like chemotaxis protein/HPt (histidine-containing phosphotransfer) domain-containing protein